MSVMTPVRTPGEQALLDRLATRPPAAADAARTAILASGLPTRRDEAFKRSDLRAALADGQPDPRGEVPSLPEALKALDPLVLTFRAEGFGVVGEPPNGV